MNEPSVVVITPTTGDSKVLDAIKSVQNQTYKNVKHLIVVDGERFYEKWSNTLNDFYFNEPGVNIWDRVSITKLADNVGANGFYGHRIFAGFAHLVNEDIVFFLDQDNWYEPTHVETMVKQITDKNLHMAYSLRNIYDKDDKFLCKDDCESLGKWFVWNSTPTEKHYHVDTSAYAFSRPFLIQVAHNWHGGYAQDRKFWNFIRLLPGVQYDTNGEYTLNYRLDGNPNSASPEFFIEGNKVQERRYGAIPGIIGPIYPWRKN